MTGYWYHPEEDAANFEEPEGVQKFLQMGEKPIFVAFGKAESPELAKALEVSEMIRKENGVSVAAKAIEDYIVGKPI